MTKYFILVLTWTSLGCGVDLSRYPFPTTGHPVDFSSIDPKDRTEAKVIPTDRVAFLFVSSCDPAEGRPELCLWAYLDTLFEAQVALQKSDGGKTLTLYSFRTNFQGSFDTVRKFVPVLRLPAEGREKFLEGVQVNGKTLRVSHWVQTRDPRGLPIPLIWLPVTADNQKRINGEYYQGLRTSPQKETKLLYTDLQAEPRAMGNGFFAVLGYAVTGAARENHYFVATRHRTETNLYTATLRRARFVDDEPQTFDWMGYTFTAPQGSPTGYESLLLEAREKNGVSRGHISPAQ